jgi:hypothetical protein
MAGANDGVLRNAVADAIQGAVAGAGTGGGGFCRWQCSAGDVFTHMLMGFLTGNVTGAPLGVFFGGFNAADADGRAANCTCSLL